MTQVLERERTEITRIPVVRHVTEWVTGVVGAVAAAIGAYVYYAPTDWFLGDVSESWAFGLFTGGRSLAGHGIRGLRPQGIRRRQIHVRACDGRDRLVGCCHRGRGDVRAHLDPLTRLMKVRRLSASGPSASVQDLLLFGLMALGPNRVIVLRSGHESSDRVTQWTN